MMCVTSRKGKKKRVEILPGIRQPGLKREISAAFGAPTQKSSTVDKK
jgi:hypothetical protein